MILLFSFFKKGEILIQITMGYKRYVQNLRVILFSGNITTVQQYVSRYRNVNFSTKIKVSVQKNIWKNLEKISRYFIYDSFLVPKYMLIIVYLNKTYIFHYYKWYRLYSTKHHLTPLYHTIHPYTSPYVHVEHHAPPYLTIYLYRSPYTSIPHHTYMYNTIHPYTSQYTHVSTHV